MSMFRCATFLFAVAKVYLFLHSANFSLFFFEEQSKILGLTGKSVSAGELDNNRTYGFTLDFFLPRIRRILRICLWEKNRSKSLLLSLGLRPCSLMRMLSHVSELPCLTLPIRLVCPLADRKPSKQNSCPWQYKMSLYRRLLTVTLDREEPVLRMFLLSFTTDLTDWTDGCGGIRQKPEKPLGEDGGLCPCCYTSALVL